MYQTEHSSKFNLKTSRQSGLLLLCCVSDLSSALRQKHVRSSRQHSRQSYQSSCKKRRCTTPIRISKAIRIESRCRKELTPQPSWALMGVWKDPPFIVKWSSTANPNRTLSVISRDPGASATHCCGACRGKIRWDRKEVVLMVVERE